MKEVRFTLVVLLLFDEFKRILEERGFSEVLSKLRNFVFVASKRKIIK
jgi:hypothetical protein